MKKNQLTELLIESISSDGNGVGKYEGMTVFVPFTAVGDKISCKIVKVNKTYAFGIIDKIISSSPARLENDGCPVSKKCGGCAFRHMTYEAEKTAKDKIVRNAFERIGGLKDLPFEEILGCENISGYRNKAQYPLAYDENKKAAAGFYAKRSHRVIPCANCELGDRKFSEITAEICDFVNREKIPLYDETSGKGLLRHICLRRGYHTGEIMVCLIVKRAEKKLFSPLAKILTEKFPDIKSVVLNINSKNTNVITGDRCIVIYGNESITDMMCGRKIKISPLSFYQVNTAQAEKLYGIAKDFAALSGEEILLDLYCGTGTVGLSMADGIKKLYGCEIIPEAVENARENAHDNNIANAEFFVGDAGKTVMALAKKNIHPDVIITDPPRKGCDELTLSSIVKMSPEKIIMISCNPATAARDVKYLSEHGYRAVKARAVDMFPRTSHVECVVLMSRVEGK